MPGTFIYLDFARLVELLEQEMSQLQDPTEGLETTFTFPPPSRSSYPSQALFLQRAFHGQTRNNG